MELLLIRMTYWNFTFLHAWTLVKFKSVTHHDKITNLTDHKMIFFYLTYVIEFQSNNLFYL